MILMSCLIVLRNTKSATWQDEAANEDELRQTDPSNTFLTNGRCISIECSSSSWDCVIVVNRPLLRSSAMADEWKDEKDAPRQAGHYDAGDHRRRTSTYC